MDANAEIAMSTVNLVTLPYDIKLEILKYLLCRDELVLYRSSSGHFKAASYPDICSDILRVSRAIYSDAVHVLYHFNRFCFLHIEFPTPWLKVIGTKNLSSITSLSIGLHLISPLRTLPKRAPYAQRLAAEADQCSKALDSVISIDMLVCYASGLRNLELFFVDRWPRSDTDSIIQSITIVQALAAMQGLSVISLSGTIPKIFVRYLRRVTRAPVRVANVKIADWDLRAHLQLARQNVLETLTLVRAELPEARPLMNTMEWIHEFEEFDIDESLDIRNGTTIDDQANYMLPRTKIARGNPTTFSRPIDLCYAGQDLRSGDYWPPNKFHERALEIEEEKLDFLMAFWNELKIVGLVVAKENQALD